MAEVPPFLDTNVLIYAATGADRRPERAREVLQEPGILSVQVLNEFANTPLRKLRRPVTEVRRALGAFRVLLGTVLPITEEDHALALDLVEDHRIAFYDAVIVATALRAGCGVLLSEDMGDGMVFRDRPRVENPLRSA